MALVSVIIPIYKAEKYIERCTRSLFSQTLDDMEFVFIDDCSPDNSVDVLMRVIEEYPERASQVVLLRNEQNRGSAYTRAKGMEAVTGEYLGFCDSDDWCEHDMYEKMYESAIKSDADLVCCGVFCERDSIAEECVYPYDNETKNKVFNYLHMEGVPFSAIWNKLFKLEFIRAKKIDFILGANHWEDMGITLRARSLSSCTVIINKAFYHYNCQNQSSMCHKINIDSYKERMICAGALCEYFKQNASDVYNEYKKYFAYLCFMSKKIFYSPEYYDFDMWRNQLRFANKYILLFSPVPVQERVKYWLTTILPSKMARWLMEKRNHKSRLPKR